MKKHAPAAGLTIRQLYVLTQPRGRDKEGTPPWPATVRRIGDWSKGTAAKHSVAANWLCPRCGQPATAVVRVPEVTDALLCRDCLVMPNRPDLEFPSLYLGFALPPTR